MFRGLRASEAYRAAALRYAEHYLLVLKRANTLAVKKGGLIAGAITLLEREWENVEAAHNWLLATTERTRRVTELISHFAYQGANLLEHVHSPDLRIRWFTAARDSALELQDLVLAGSHLDNLALAHAAAGDSELALTLYSERIEVARRMADEEGEASAECNLGTLLKDCGRPHEALEHMERSLEIDRRNGNVKREGESLAAIGTVHFTMGDATTALEYFESATRLAQSHALVDLLATVLCNVANCYVELGQRDRARELYSERIRLAREARDNRGLALGLVNWSLLVSAEVPDAAAKACEEASGLVIDEPRIRGYILDSYGVALRRSGDLSRARDAYDTALRLAEEANDLILRLRVLGHIAYLLAMQGETGRATAMYEEQRQLAQQVGAKRPEAWALDMLSQIYHETGDHRRAAEYAVKALGLLEQAKLPDAEEMRNRVERWARREAESTASKTGYASSE